MAAPNIAALTTIKGRTAVQAVGTSATAILANAGSSGKALKVNSLYVSNVHASANKWITVDHYRSATAIRICYQMPVPLNATLVVIEKDSPVYLEEGDDIRLTGEATSSLEAVISYEELS